MKIIVLMKQVANKDAVLRIGPDEKWINETDVAQQTNESDGYALEEALRLKESKGEGEVIVCSLGPQSVSLRSASPGTVRHGAFQGDLAFVAAAARDKPRPVR